MGVAFIECGLTNWNEGLQNTAPPKPHCLPLLAEVRRAPIDDHLYLLAWLDKDFGRARS